MPKKEEVVKEKIEKSDIGKQHKNFFFRHPKAEKNILFHRTIDTIAMHCPLSKGKKSWCSAFL